MEILEKVGKTRKTKDNNDKKDINKYQSRYKKCRKAKEELYTICAEIQNLELGKIVLMVYQKVKIDESWKMSNTDKNQG